MKRLILFCFLGFAVSLQTHAQSKSIKKLDAYFENARQAWNIPGIAIAIVKDNEVLLSKGYGVKSTTTNEAVDEHSLFAIASNSKAFTTAALAMLVDEGKISWEDKVRDYLPYFELYNPYVSNEMTIRDLVCHRSGLATFSGDLIWYGTKYNREEVIRKAKYLEPKYGFREHFGYQNIMFVAAGEIIPAVTGMSWDDFIEERFFKPLGMDESVTSILDFRKGDNIASPHNEVNGTNIPIEYVNWDNVGPAGSINSCVDDLAHWMMLQLNHGTKDSTLFWSEEQHQEMWSVQTPQQISAWSQNNIPSKTFSGYGLGWDIFNYHGKKIVNHGGGYDGMISKTVLVPEENLGFVVLTNNINFLSSALMYRVLDEFLGVKDKKDWAGDWLEFKIAGEDAKIKGEQEAEASRIKDTKPSLPLEAYAGTYSGAMYGDCIVRVIGDQLSFQFEPTPLFRGTMRHWHYDTFQLNWGAQMMLPSGLVQFIIGTDGKVEEMKIDVPNPDFDFTELEFMKQVEKE